MTYYERKEILTTAFDGTLEGEKRGWRKEDAEDGQ